MQSGAPGIVVQEEEDSGNWASWRRCLTGREMKSERERRAECVGRRVQGREETGTGHDVETCQEVSRQSSEEGRSRRREEVDELGVVLVRERVERRRAREKEAGWTRVGIDPV
jgi:hypothetical protein